MYAEQYLVKQHHQERLKQAEEAHLAWRLTQLSRAKRQQERAERQLIRAWERLEALWETASVS